MRWLSAGLVPVSPGRTYELSIWARSEATFNTATGHVHVVAEYYDGAGIFLSSGGAISVNPTTSWSAFSGSSTTPPNAANVKLSIGYSSTSLSDLNKVHFDDVSLALTATP